MQGHVTGEEEEEKDFIIRAPCKTSHSPQVLGSSKSITPAHVPIPAEDWKSWQQYSAAFPVKSPTCHLNLGLPSDLLALTENVE